MTTTKTARAILAAPATAPLPRGAWAEVQTAMALARAVRPSTLGGLQAYLERWGSVSPDYVAFLTLRLALARDPKLAQVEAYITLAKSALGQRIISK